MNATPTAAALPELATKKQLAAYCQVSEQTIERMVKRGELPHRKLGRLIRFPSSAALAALGVSTTQGGAL